MERPADESLSAASERAPVPSDGRDRSADRGSDGCGISYNLQGQRLGRKGRDTRERIIAAAQELVAEPIAPGRTITLSEVARRAKLRVGSLYLYFCDLTELLLAVLDPVMVAAEDDFVRLLRPRWNDEELGERALEFVQAYYAFWVRHARLLHLRNSMADNLDERMMRHRVGSVQPLIQLLVEQMASRPSAPRDSAADVLPNIPMNSMATALMTGLERMVSVTTDPNLAALLSSPKPTRQPLLQAEARLIELAIRDYRHTPGERDSVRTSCRRSP